MKIFELLTESGISKEVTLKAISANIGSPISALYDQLEIAAKKFYAMADSDKVAEKKEPWGFVKGNFTSRWREKFWNNLQSHLKDLCKLYPNSTQQLENFLSYRNADVKNNFTEIEKTIPRLLKEIGKSIGNKNLVFLAEQWEVRKEKLQKQIAEHRKEHVDFINDRDREDKEPDQSKILSAQQRSQVETVVNALLEKLPKEIRQEIRPIVDRADNKLAALKAELAKRNLIS